MAGYSHLLCYRKKTSKHTETLPDVIFRGDQIWEKGSGLNACLMAVKYAKNLGTKCVIDPFCGKGSVLAVANWLGLDAVGVEIKASLARNAKSLVVKEEQNGSEKKRTFGWKKES